MSSDALGFNKIAFCVLGTGLALIGFNQGASALFPATHHAKEGYHIDAPEIGKPGETAVVEGPRDYNKLISAGDSKAGELVSAKCKQCHDLTSAMTTVTGPPLFGVFGRDIASMSFKYSEGMTKQEGVWTYEHFDHFLEKPKKAVPGTAMSFIGLSKQVDRSNLMAWLRTQTSGEPLALPPPLPETPVAPVDGAAPVPANGATPAPAPSAPAQPAPSHPAPAHN